VGHPQCDAELPRCSAPWSRYTAPVMLPTMDHLPVGRIGYTTTTMLGTASAVSDTVRSVTVRAIDESDVNVESSHSRRWCSCKHVTRHRATWPPVHENQHASRRLGWRRPHSGRWARSRGMDPAALGVNGINHSLAAHVTVGGGIVPT